MDVFDKIAKGLRESGRTQTQLSRVLKWHVSKVSNATRHQLKYPPTSEEMKKIAQFFGWPLGYLYDDGQEEPDPVDGLSEPEKYILRVVRKIGFEAAMDRLAPGLAENEAAHPSAP